MFLSLFTPKLKIFSRLSNNGAAYWGKKTKGGLPFSKSSSRTKIKDITERSGIKLSNSVLMPVKSSVALKKHYKYKIDDIFSKNDDGTLKFYHNR